MDTVYREIGFRSRRILARELKVLVKSLVAELALCDQDVEAVLYDLAQRGWKYDCGDDRQLRLFPIDKYTDTGKGVRK